MRSMRIEKMTALLTILVLQLGLCACGTPQTASQPEAEATASMPQGTPQKSAPAEPARKNVNILVAYFSCTGTTEALAGSVAELLNADLFEIIPENPYTECMPEKDFLAPI